MMRGIFVLAAFALAATPLAAAAAKALFASDDVIHLTVTGPLPKAANPAATQDILGIAGINPETLPVTLDVRGITRRSYETCTFPPLRITFAQKPPESSLFKGQKKLKLVTHCRATGDFQQYVLTEYAAYRIYDLMTPLAFRVRLATVNYVARPGVTPLTRIGYLIEDDRDVAKRNGLEGLKGTDGRKRPDKVPVSALSGVDAARFAVFEYLIGNLDWAMTAGPVGAGCCHNAKLLQSKDGAGLLIPVPYDFDFSGLVDTPYATPPAGIDVPNVWTRFYRGYCRDNAQAAAVIDDLRAKQAAIYALFDAIPGLNRAKRATALNYLNLFFTQVSTPDGRDRMLRTCLH